MQMMFDVLGDQHASTPGKAWQLHSTGEGWSATATSCAEFLLSMIAHGREHLTLMVDDVVQLSVVAPEAQESLQAAHCVCDDLSCIPAGTSRLPASLLSKLSMVSLHDSIGSSDKPREMAHDATHQDLSVSKSMTVLKRPLIEELEP